MNEDERGITPANVTTITVDRPGRDWRVIIEQGNGDVIKMFELTGMERIHLGMMLAPEPPVMDDVSFVDFSRGGCVMADRPPPASSSEPFRPSSLGEEFAIFADEASAWAELTLSAASETWPDMPPVTDGTPPSP